MSGRIGILGGMSYQSTIEYYDLICRKYYDRYHDYHYPEVAMYSLDFQKVIDFEKSENEDAFIRYILDGIESLAAIPVDVVLMAANSPHKFYSQLSQKASVPILSIAKATMKKAAEDKSKKLLLLGVKFTMQASFYPDEGKLFGIEVITPVEEEQNIIDGIILKELCMGHFTESSRTQLLDIIRCYTVDGVILGSSELPLILKQEDCPVKLYNTAVLHVESALEAVLNEK